MRNEGVSGSQMSDTRSTAGGTAIDNDSACADSTPPAAYANRMPQLERRVKRSYCLVFRINLEASSFHTVLVENRRLKV